MKHTSSVSAGSVKPADVAAILGPPVTREDALERIRQDQDAFLSFSGFPEKDQEKILEFIQGNRGLPILYDSFFKRIMNPDTHPERLEQFLSALSEQPVRIRSVLPVESTKLFDGGSLVIMDILIELSDGTIVDVEMQKIGYAFPGERSSCYLSDLIMRQYNRVRSERRHLFSFRDLKPVWLIILMENSSGEFRAAAPHYVHRSSLVFDSGVKVRSLEHMVYISLDTFHEVVQNISKELDAWLTFLSSDRPADIVRLVGAYPQFAGCYQDIIDFRRHPKELIGMYSEALAIMDRNTVLYMCDEQKKEIEDRKREIEAQGREIEAQEREIEAQGKEIEARRKENEGLTEQLHLAEAENAKKDSVIAALREEISRLKNA